MDRPEEPDASLSFLPFQQSPVYAEAALRMGTGVRWLDSPAGPVLAMQRGPLRVILRGPLWPQSAPTRDRVGMLRRLARWPGLTIATPEEPVSGFGLVPLLTPMHHAVWRLGPDLRAGMARNWRGHLTQAERAGVQVVAGDRATLETLIAAEALQRETRPYRALPAGFVRALPQQALRIWAYRTKAGLQAAMAFVRHGTSATYHLAWGSDSARAAGAHALMLTQAAEALAAEGVAWLDLGSVDSDRAPGLARFKLGTGAALRRLGATMLVLP